jgi:hypothetical protein
MVTVAEWLDGSFENQNTLKSPAFKMCYRNTKTTNEPTASNNKSESPQVKICDT